jgi:hypothetical protein
VALFGELFGVFAFAFGWTAGEEAEALEEGEDGIDVAGLDGGFEAGDGFFGEAAEAGLDGPDELVSASGELGLELEVVGEPSVNGPAVDAGFGGGVGDGLAEHEGFDGAGLLDR